jgi:hypothetical protein
MEAEKRVAMFTVTSLIFLCIMAIIPTGIFMIPVWVFGVLNGMGFSVAMTILICLYLFFVLVGFLVVIRPKYKQLK